MSVPRLQFVIGGVQKGGTTALAQLLAQHAQIALPNNKEAHIFDAPEFDDAWTAAQVDLRYDEHFPPAPAGAAYGDATPIYCFHPRFIQRIVRYNPAMRWIIILRHPVERAISHYYMERGRGLESWPLWPALLLERFRLRGHWQDFAPDSPLRRYSYRSRGDYARQLDTLYAHFPPEQVLLLRNDDLAREPQRIVDTICDFLGVNKIMLANAHARVFAGRYPRWSRGSLRFAVLSWLMAAPMRRARQRYGLDWR